MPTVDLVLEGGGVKGIGLVGAVSVLERAGYTFRRIAGTSAGAIVASFIAAGMSVDQLLEEMRGIDYKKMEDGSKLAHLGTVGQGLSALFEHGAFRGDFMHNWVAEKLASLGVRTWRDLQMPDHAGTLSPEEKYRLVVIASDISRGKMLRMPWDYAQLCDLDPDDQPVADAVRASASIPFFFSPMKLTCGCATDEHAVTLVDGGLLSNFPVEIFGTAEDKPYPTIGIKLSARPDDRTRHWHPAESGVQMALAIIGTMASAHDQLYIDDPGVQRRTIFVDTMGIKATQFAIDTETRERLFVNGVEAATKFLQQAEDVSLPDQRPQLDNEVLATP